MKKGNNKIYSKYLKPIKTLDRFKFREIFITKLYGIGTALINNPSTKSETTSWRWMAFNGHNITSKDYDIFWSIANICRVKIMWEIIMLSPTEYVKCLRIIGEDVRVKLCMALLDDFFWFEQNYKDNLIDKAKKKKGVNLRVIKADASSNLASQRRIIYNIIKDELVFDPEYNHWLESQVMQHIKLNYKKYKADKHEYYHAISRKFCHKRMIC